MPKRVIPPCCERPTIDSSIRDGFCGLCRQEQQRELDEWKSGHTLTMDDIRQQCVLRLSQTDWTQVLDAPITPACQSAYREFRQIIRDIPQRFSDPYKVVWPDEPEVMKT